MQAHVASHEIERLCIKDGGELSAPLWHSEHLLDCFRFFDGLGPNRVQAIALFDPQFLSYLCSSRALETTTDI